MALSLEEVEHIAVLARLELSESEKAHFREQLSSILDFAARLQELDTSAIPPTASVLLAQLRLRPDEIQPGLSREELLRIAPASDGKMFQVPPVLD
jgi:aspartyl-tRNA(Asn)/glutamyl-tRNA(Gln) amidotransferase subunit C